MDPLALESIKLVAATALGKLWQHTRANPRFNNGLGYVLFGLAAGAGWLWATPGWNTGDWRVTVLGLVLFVLASRGSAAALKDAGAAPPSA